MMMLTREKTQLSQDLDSILFQFIQGWVYLYIDGNVYDVYIKELDKVVVDG